MKYQRDIHWSGAIVPLNVALVLYRKKWHIRHSLVHLRHFAVSEIDMIRVAILAFEGVPLSSIALPADIFLATGTFWNRLFGRPEELYFNVRVVSLDGQSVSCHRSISINPDGALADIDRPDLLIITGLTDLQSPLLESCELSETLQELHRNGTVLASICTGAFVLAATGLLNGKRATTHWGLAKLFARRFPEVILEPQQTITDEGSLLCSGGANAGADLALHLVRRYCGIETACHCAKALLLDPARTSQSPYEVYHSTKNHGDEQITPIQQWLEKNFHTSISIDLLARRAAMSRRTFERRFKNATGDSPLQYLQRIRVENAKFFLETSQKSFDEITTKVGYEDSSTFRRIFSKTTGLQPGSYREKFNNR